MGGYITERLGFASWSWNDVLQIRTGDQTLQEILVRGAKEQLNVRESTPVYRTICVNRDNWAVEVHLYSQE